MNQSRMISICCCHQVHAYLRYSSWDTRIAAGQAVDAIARNVSQWTSRREGEMGGDTEIVSF